MQRIKQLEQLKALFKAPQPLVLDKVVTGLDVHTRKFIELCPFAIYSSQNAQGQLDLSPRGGKPGFILIENDHTLWLPEYAGNDRIDTLTNLLNQPAMGMLLMVPGMGETLRLKGQASLFAPNELNQDAPDKWIQTMTSPPKILIRFQIETLYFQCAAAIKLAKLWSNTALVNRDPFPSIYKIIEDQIAQEQIRQKKP